MEDPVSFYVILACSCIIIIVIMIIIVIFYKNSNKWRSLHANIAATSNDISTGMTTNMDSKQIVDVDQNKKLHDLSSSLVTLKNLHSANVDSVDFNMKRVQDLIQGEVNTLDANIKSSRVFSYPEQSKANLVNMTNTLNNLDVQYNILNSKVQASPSYAQVNILASLHSNITDLDIQNLLMLRNIENTSNTIVTDTKTQEQILQESHSALNDYVSEENYLMVKSLMDESLMKKVDHQNFISMDMLTQDYVPEKMLNSLSTDIQSHIRKMKYYAQKTDLENYVESLVAESNYVTTNMLQTYNGKNDLATLTRSSFANMQQHGMENKIQNINSSINHFPSIYGDKAIVDRLLMKTQSIYSDFQQSQAQLNMILDNYVSVSDFNTMQAKIHSLETANNLSTNGFNGLQSSVGDLTNTVNMLKSTYVTQEAAMSTYGLQSQLTPFPGLTSIQMETLQKGFDSVYPSSSNITGFQKAINSWSFKNLAGLPDYISLSNIVSGKIAYLQQHLNDPITLTGYAAYSLNGLAAAPTSVNEWNSYSDAGAHSTGTSSSYKVHYPFVAFYSTPTNVVCSCTSDPTINVSCLCPNNVHGFVISTQCPSKVNLARIQLFKWEATGPRASDYKSKKVNIASQSGPVSYVLNGNDPKMVVADQAGGWKNGWSYLESDFDKNWPSNVPMSYWSTSWFKVDYPKQFSGPPTSVFAKCTSTPSGIVSISHNTSLKSFLIYFDVSGILSGSQLAATQTFQWEATGPLT